MPMNVLITGGTGFLGSNVATRLRERGHSVRLLGRNAQKGQALASQGFEFCQADITDADAVQEASTGQDCIIHCAGFAADHGEYDLFYRINVEGTRNVVQACRNNHVKHLVNISTPGVYFNFRDRLNIKESDPLPAKQATPYADTKLRAEEIIDAAVGQGLSAVSLRPRAIIGPGDNIYLPAMLEKVKHGCFPMAGGGRALVDVIYIDNMVDAVVLAMEAKPGLSGEKFNITNGEPIMFRELVGKLFDSMQQDIRFINLPVAPLYAIATFLEWVYAGLRIESKPFVTRYSVGLVATSQTHDIGKARELLGFRPKVSIDEGFRRLARHWAQQPVA